MSKFHFNAAECTFLILDKAKYEATQNEIESLIGDTNLFLQSNHTINDAEVIKGNCAEVEIMIAEPTAHGQHFGWESMLLMLKYGQTHLNCGKFVAKIGFTNVKSCRMFEKIGFTEVSRSNVFQEITYERNVSAQWVHWLDTNTTFELCNYC